MYNISKARLTIPKEIPGEIPRNELVDSVINSQKKLIYIHAAAGYGKTIFLSQIARIIKNPIWLSLDGENNILSFLDTLSAAVQNSFPGFVFPASTYVLFETREDFPLIVADALIASMETLSTDVITILIDDMHLCLNKEIRRFVTCLADRKTDRLMLCISSREAPWQELIPFKAKGRIFEVSQKELSFSKTEVINLLGFEYPDIYRYTEGWPLALGSIKVLIENGVAHSDIHISCNEILNSYLFYECISRLPTETISFLSKTSCFIELEPCMIDAVLDMKNSRLVLDSLSSRNIFTIKTTSGHYRYHHLFRQYLQESMESPSKFGLLEKALNYYYNNKQFSKAAEYAIILKNSEILGSIIQSAYKELIQKGNFNILRNWFQALEDMSASLSPMVLAAKVSFLSSAGNFSAAKTSLDKFHTVVNDNDMILYNEVMLHKARIARNMISFEESNKLLDKLIEQTEIHDLEALYPIVIEKIYNLCWTSKVREAYTLINKMIETCLKAGNLKIKSWFERYLTVVHYFAGRMKDASECFEKSSELPADEQQHLDIHNVGIFASKAYQLMGCDDKAIDLITAELDKLIRIGRYEELWSAYLFAADIYSHIGYKSGTGRDSRTCEMSMKYFKLAAESASLFRTTGFQLQWSVMQSLASSLMFENSNHEKIVNKILNNLDNANTYLKTLILEKLFTYFSSISDYPSAIIYARQAIEAGEDSDIMMVPTIAYGLLARVAILIDDNSQAVELTSRYFTLCSQNSIYWYFKLNKFSNTILEFAIRNKISTEFTSRMIAFSGYKAKKVYINTFGGFSIFPYDNRKQSFKMRTKKERELLAFLLDSGVEGVTKNQIYLTLWSDSESNDIKKLIGVYFAHIKNDFAKLGVENPIVNDQNHYSINKSEIECDSDIFEEAAREFKEKKSIESAKRVISLYRGEYMSVFEAVWAYKKSMLYEDIYHSALRYINPNE